MSLVRVFSLFLALLTLASCAEPLGLDDAGPIVVAAVAGAVRITNRSSGPVYYIPFEATTAATSLWGPCTDPDRCARVNPGEVISLPNSAFGGYKPGDDEGIVYWWRLTGEDPKEYFKGGRNIHAVGFEFR
jgi:hypothetical protein